MYATLTLTLFGRVDASDGFFFLNAQTKLVLRATPRKKEKKEGTRSATLESR